MTEWFVGWLNDEQNHMMHHIYGWYCISLIDRLITVLQCFVFLGYNAIQLTEDNPCEWAVMYNSFLVVID